MSEKRIKPLLLDWKVGTVHPAYDTIEVLVLAILQFSWSCMSVTIKEMPDFEPNEYLFETFKDKGKERWEIYAWALRDAMMQAGKLEACDYTLKEKLQYEGFMQMKPKFKTPFYEEPDTEANKKQGPINEEVEMKGLTDIKPSHSSNENLDS